MVRVAAEQAMRRSPPSACLREKKVPLSQFFSAASEAPDLPDTHDPGSPLQCESDEPGTERGAIE